MRGRLGIAIDRLLVFGSRGYVWANLDQIISNDVTDYVDPTSSSSRNRNLEGHIWGAGLEYPVTGNWLSRLEYRQTQLENLDWSAFGLSASGTYDADALHEVRLGMSYMF